jgi:hypothetical protein
VDSCELVQGMINGQRCGHFASSYYIIAGFNDQKIYDIVQRLVTRLIPYMGYQYYMLHISIDVCLFIMFMIYLTMLSVNQTIKV